MGIRLGELFRIENLQDYKMHFAVWNGEDQPLDIFVTDKDAWKGWNSWRIPMVETTSTGSIFFR